MSRARRHDLKVEIAAILVVKLCLLAALWFAFFRGPPVALDSAAVARHALRPAGGGSVGD